MLLTTHLLRDGAPIVLALNGQPDTSGAIRFANALSRRYGNDVHVVTVLEPLPLSLLGMEPLPDELLEQRSRDAQRRVADRVRMVLGREYDWPVEVRIGRVAPSVAAAARDWNAAAIVMGIGRHQTLDRFLGSETSTNIVAQSTVTVIAVPEWVTGLPRTAIVGTDFGDCSLDAARAAVDCLVLPAAMTLIHATPAIEPVLVDRDLLARYRDQVPGLFELLVRQLDVRPGIAVSTAIVSGHPAVEILSKADERSADLMVVGSEGFGAEGPRRIGTVASRLLRAARCTVMIAPARNPASATDRQGEREGAALT